MLSVTAIVLAAGSGKRFKGKISKPLVALNSKPIIAYSLGILNKHPFVESIIVVVNRKNSGPIKRVIKQKKINKVLRIIEGGRRRQDSVENGLRSIDSRADLVLIHDGARPFIDSKLVSSVIKEASVTGAAIPGVPVKGTVKKLQTQNSRLKTKLLVKKTIDRDNLWEAQTPQVFRAGLILQAYKKFGKLNVTDDAMLVEKLGARVSVVLGSYNNIKITTPEDLVLAGAIAKNLWNTK